MRKKMPRPAPSPGKPWRPATPIPPDAETRLIRLVPRAARRERLLDLLLQVEDELDMYDRQVPF